MTYDPKQYWEIRGRDYKVSVDTSAELRNLAKLILLYGNACDSIAEIGSGYGRIFKYLCGHGLLKTKSFFMFDIAESMINKCEELTGVRPQLWDGQKISCSDNMFDWVISFSVFLHVPPSDFQDVFREHIRICRKFLYIATYCGKNKDLAEHCFGHDYKPLIYHHGLRVLHEKKFLKGQRVNWLLEKKIFN